MTGFLIALLSGALMSVQGVFNTQVTKTTGLWVSNIWGEKSYYVPAAKATQQEVDHVKSILTQPKMGL